MASDNSDIEQAFTITVLDDFADKTCSDCSLVLEPLGDAIGWRATAVTSTDLVLGRASATTALAAVDPRGVAGVGQPRAGPGRSRRR